LRAVTGSNRGIGYTLAATIAARPNTIVFAGARNPAAQSLKDLAARHSNVHPIKLTSGDESDNAAAVAEIQKIAGRIDVVIANAGTPKFPLSDYR
jgi:norsolorinic acid ketoreductase